jgi:hypothetical protein
MKLLYVVGLPLVLLAGPVLAEPSCQGDMAKVPMWRVAKSFEEQGGAIREMKTANGCYEIYGEQAKQRVEVFYDPQTGTELERE